MADGPLLDHMDEIQVAVHLLVFDERPAENDLRNQHDGNDEDAGLALGDERGNDEPDRGPVRRREEHRREDNPESIAQGEQGVSNEGKERALDDREEGQRQNLRSDIEAEIHIQIPLAHEHRTVVDDVVHAIGEAEEHGHDEREEEVGGNVKRGGEIVNRALGISEDHPGEQRQERGLEDCGEEVGAVAKFAEKSAAEQDTELAELLAHSEALGFAGFGQGFLGLRRRLARCGGLADFLEQAIGFVFVAPVIRREAPRGDELASVVFLQNNVAAEVA